MALICSAWSRTPARVPVTADRFRAKGSRGSDPRLLRPNNGPATRPHIGERPRASRIVQALGLDQPSISTISPTRPPIEAERKTLRSREAKEAITDHEEAQRTLLGNLERLPKQRLARPCLPQRLGYPHAAVLSQRPVTHVGQQRRAEQEHKHHQPNQFPPISDHRLPPRLRGIIAA